MEDQPYNQPDAPGQACLERGLERLREGGFRLTRQRRAILELFRDVGQHMTAREIYERLEPDVSSLSVATVYNTVELFDQEGIVNRVIAEDGSTYFDPNVQPHHHGVCRQCNEIFDMQVADDSLSLVTASSDVLEYEDNHLEVDEATVWFRGICRDCQEHDEASNA